MRTKSQPATPQRSTSLVVAAAFIGMLLPESSSALDPITEERHEIDVAETTEAKGYVATAGYFDSEAVLKLYYELLRKNAGQHFVQTPFYFRQPSTGSGYLLGLAYFPGEQVLGSEAEKSAHQACARMTKHRIRCDVQYHQFNY